MSKSSLAYNMAIKNTLWLRTNTKLINGPHTSYVSVSVYKGVVQYSVRLNELENRISYLDLDTLMFMLKELQKPFSPDGACLVMPIKIKTEIVWPPLSNMKGYFTNLLNRWEEYAPGQLYDNEFEKASARWQHKIESTLLERAQ